VPHPGGEGEQRQYLVGVQQQDHGAGASGQVVAEEGGRAEVALSFEGDVVEDVIEVDQEAAGGDSCGEGGGTGGGQDGGTGNRRRDEMASRAHAALTWFGEGKLDAAASTVSGLDVGHLGDR